MISEPFANDNIDCVFNVCSASPVRHTSRTTLHRWLIGLIALVLFGSSQTSLSAFQTPGWTEQVEQFVLAGEGERAIAMLDAKVKENPQSASLVHMRGAVHFRLANIDASLKDFDAAIALDPRSKPYDWQRGIALYYGKRYEEGREQFEVHRTVNPNDVENSVWHYLCVVKLEGIDGAKKVLIPSAGDSRPPLMDVLRLFRGEVGPEFVQSSAEDKRHGPKGQALAQFYGYLYMGLYYHSLDQADSARRCLEKCLEQKTGGYMADVAHVHLKLFP